MRVSVIIPTHNRQAYVQLAIESALKQTCSDFEIIVIDDGSSDGTRDALARFGNSIRYTYQSNRGVSFARNHGLALARGEYVAFLDADDLWLPHKLETQLGFLEAERELALVSSGWWTIDESGQRISLYPYLPVSKNNAITFSTLLQRNVIGTSTVVVRRDALPETEPFDPVLSYGEDWDLWLHLTKQRRAQVLPVPLAMLRTHRYSLSSARDLTQIKRILHDSLRVIHKNVSGESSTSSKQVTMATAKRYLIAALDCWLIAERDFAITLIGQALYYSPDILSSDDLAALVAERALAASSVGSGDLKAGLRYIREIIGLFGDTSIASDNLIGNTAPMYLAALIDRDIALGNERAIRTALLRDCWMVPQALRTAQFWRVWLRGVLGYRLMKRFHALASSGKKSKHS